MKRTNRLVLVCAILGLPAFAMADISSNTINFQPGVDGYGSLVERLISTQTSAELPSTTSETPENWFVDGGTPDQQALMRWENIIGSNLNQIPVGATILDARLTLTTGSAANSGNAQTGGYFGVAGLTGKMVDYSQPGFPVVSRQFDNTTTYVNYNAGGPNYENGKGTFVNRPVGSFVDPLSDELDGDSVIDQDQVVSANVTSLVQRWAKSPSTNYGLSVQAGVPQSTTDGWMFGTQWNADETRRPKLEVTYTTDAIETVSFQQGVNGYTGGVNGWVRADNNVAQPFDGEQLNQAFLDGPAANSPDDQGNFRFNNIFSDEGGLIARDAEIVDAYFVLTTGDQSVDARSPGSFEARPILRDWDTDIGNTEKPSLYSEWSNGFGPSFDDPDGNNDVDLGELLGRFDGITHAQVMPVDITELVKQWQSGEMENYGINVQSFNTANGWQINWNGATDETARPMLMIRLALTTSNWIADADGIWSVASNWQNNSIAEGAGVAAVFGDVITASRTVTLDGNQTLGSVKFDSSFGYAIAGSNMLTFSRSAGDVKLDVIKGNHVISAPVTFANNSVVEIGEASSLTLSGTVNASGMTMTKNGTGTLNLPGLRAAGFTINAGAVAMTAANTNAAASVLGSLSVAAGATLDLNDNAVILDYASGDLSPLAALSAAIADGRITSSIAEANSRYAIGLLEGSDLAGGIFAGITLDADTVVADLTLKGDTNLSYTVTFDDLLSLAQNYGGNGKVWSDGDSNYDGLVNFDDLLALAQNYGNSAFNTSDALSDAGIGSSFVSDWALALSIVPEPTSFAAIAFAAGVIRRRRNA